MIIADYFTKPLQGRNFILFRDMIMGKKQIDDIIDDLSLSHAMNERVEKY